VAAESAMRFAGDNRVGATGLGSPRRQAGHPTSRRPLHGQRALPQPARRLDLAAPIGSRQRVGRSRCTGFATQVTWAPRRCARDWHV